MIKLQTIHLQYQNLYAKETPSGKAFTDRDEFGE